MEIPPRARTNSIVSSGLRPDGGSSRTPRARRWPSEVETSTPGTTRRWRPRSRTDLSASKEPSRVSWSVMAMPSRPASTAASRISSTSSLPSEKAEWTWRSRRRRRGGEVDEPPLPHPAGEVPVGGGEADLLFGDDPHVGPEAGAAAGGPDHRPRPDEGLQDPRGEGLEEDLPRGGDDEGPGLHLSPLQDPGGDLQVLQAAVGAGPDEDLVDLRPRQVADGADLVYPEGDGDLGGEIRDVELHLRVVRPGVGSDRLVGPPSPAPQVLLGRPVCRDDGGLRPHLDPHVAEGHPPRDGEALHRLPQVLQGPVGGAVGSYRPDEHQGQVLGEDHLTPVPKAPKAP